MKNYVLVKIEGNNLTIGAKEYETKDDAISRQSKLSELGIDLRVMTFHEAIAEQLNPFDR